MMAGVEAGITAELVTGVAGLILFLGEGTGGGANPSTWTEFGLISFANISERVFCVS